jgi:hypothetical protein
LWFGLLLIHLKQGSDCTGPYIMKGTLSCILANMYLFIQGHKLEWLLLPRVSLVACVALAK